MSEADGLAAEYDQWTDAVVRIEVHVCDRGDMAAAITGAAREARKLVRGGKLGTFDEQFCNGAQRVSIYLRPTEPEAEEA